MTQALFFHRSHERLQERIQAVAPGLEIALYDDEGRCSVGGREVALEELSPEYFWIHSELFGSPRLDDYFRIMLASPSARWLHTINTGLDRPEYLSLLRQGVTITNNHAQAIAIAEYVMGQVLAHYQEHQALSESQRRGEWRYRRFREVHGTRWLIVGFGQIGMEVARRARVFGAHVSTVRRRRDSEGLADEVLGREEMAAALEHADVVVLACASNQQTRGMVDAPFLARMREGSALVNIARGDLVVEDALRASLDRGRPACAILDVFNREPPAPDSWVWRHPRVRLTPHSSNAGSGMRARSDQLFLDNLSRVMRGEPLLNQVEERDIL